MQISQSAIDLIIREEDSDETYYSKFCAGYEWPEGASGPTIGIGYDCGYVSRDELVADWSGIIPDAAVQLLLPAVGIKGLAAQAFVSRHRHDICITWQQAVTEFTMHEVPKWISRTTAALPNCDRLSGDSLGALVSLSYNRGPDYSSQNDRRREMVNIKLHMAALEFGKIPQEFLNMRRLWSPGGDLWRRREHEAALFQAGLSQPAGV